MIILGIISYFIIGFITGIVICKIKGKEWCRANTACGFDEFSGDGDNNAEFIMYFSTFAWVLFILFSPFLLLHRIIRYTSKKLQK